jgi:hypothetical protein
VPFIIHSISHLATGHFRFLPVILIAQWWHLRRNLIVNVCLIFTQLDANISNILLSFAAALCLQRAFLMSMSI